MYLKDVGIRIRDTATTVWFATNVQCWANTRQLLPQFETILMLSVALRLDILPKLHFAPSWGAFVVFFFFSFFSTLFHNDPAAHQDHRGKCRIRTRDFYPRSLVRYQWPTTSTSILSCPRSLCTLLHGRMVACRQPSSFLKLLVAICINKQHLSRPKICTYLWD